MDELSLLHTPTHDDEPKKKILILVEGEKTDMRLMEAVLHAYHIDARYEIVSYNTNIYALYDGMFNGRDPDDIDVLLHLRSRERDEEKKNCLMSDILILFWFLILIPKMRGIPPMPL